jgi:iron(III) transport system substrate-binding protein
MQNSFNKNRNLLATVKAYPMGLALLALCLLGFAFSCSRQAKRENTVVIYVSADRPFSEPVLQAFEKKSGISVKAVYDTEETKSTGLANRLLAEKNNPQADVFWSGESVRTLILKKNGVLAAYNSPSADSIPPTFKDPEGYWTGFSARCRVILCNTNLVKKGESPQSIFDLTDPRWKDKITISDPRFGTMSFQAAALFTILGDEKATKFFRDLKQNGVKVAPSNSDVRRLVENGEVTMGLTDTDDANTAITSGMPVAMVFPDEQGMGTPFMPNMVSLIAGAPHPENGKRLIDFLLSPQAEEMLAKSEAVQVPLHPSSPPPANLPAINSLNSLKLDYAQVAAQLDGVISTL